MKVTPLCRASASAAILIAVILVASCSRSSKPVATIDGQPVTAAQWSVFLENRGVSQDAPKTELEEALKRLVRRCISARTAERQGLLKGEDWEAVKRVAEETALLQAYVEAREGKSLQPAEAEARTFYQDRKEVRRLRRIVCKTEAQAGEALKKLQGGAAFAAVAKSSSLDSSTAPNGGEAGWVHRNDLPPEMAAKLFGAKAGEVVGPLQAGGAWALLEVEEVKTPTADEFKQEKPDVFQALRFSKLTEARNKTGKELLVKNPIKVDEAVLASDSTLEIKPGDDKKVAVTAGKLTVSVAEVKRFAKTFFQNAGEPPSADPGLGKKLCEELALNRLLAQAARSDGIDRRPRAKDLAWDATEEASGRRFALSYLEKLNIPEATLQAFYERHRQAFTVPSGLRLQMIGAPAPELLGQAIQALEGGAALEEVLSRLGPQGLRASPEPGSWVPESELAQMVSPKLAEALAKVPVGKWLGPIPAEGGARAIRVAERRAGRTVPFSEAAPQVKEAYLQESGRTLVYDYLDGPARASFKIETFPENLAATRHGKTK